MLTEHLYSKYNGKSILEHQYDLTPEKPLNSPIMERFFAILNLITKRTKEERQSIKIKVLTDDFAFWKESTTKLNIMLKPFGSVINEMDTAKSESFVLSSKVIKKEFNNDGERRNSVFYQREIERCQKLLNNPNFVNKADPEIIEKERKKLKKYSELLEKTQK